MDLLILELEKATSLREAFLALWHFLRQFDWGSPQAWLLRGSIAAVCIALFVWAIKYVLEHLVSLAEAWAKLGLPVPFRTREQKTFLRRRQQFCRVLCSDLDQLNKFESWNDQQFTDLEAEVETDGWYYATRLDRLRRKRTLGQRRVPSLMSAIVSSAEQCLLVIGEPGSGKSVALRHLARELAAEGTKSNNLHAPIPLYVNLKELPASGDGPSADWIRDFVVENVRRGDADTAQYVRDHWRSHMEQGLWLFLFDSFDEIPAIMHAPAESTALDAHANALRLFLSGMSDCRGVLASREFKGPRTLPWPKLRILALTDAKQREFVGNWYFDPTRQRVVIRHANGRGRLAFKNPLFLSLLCRYVKEEGAAPDSDHTLVHQHLMRMTQRECDRTQQRFGLSPEQLMSGATWLAALFARESSLSLAPTYDEIGAFAPDGIASLRYDTVLDALVDAKIGRTDVRESKRGDRRFSFAHRRYQEVLFVQHLSSNLEEISPDELLSTPYWREYCVALLQTASAEVTPRL
jgi:hypothetical protein